jgi:hypothetical protein
MNTFDYSKHLPVLAGLKLAYQKFRHHTTFTQRVKPYIEAALPGYTVSVQVEKRSLIGNSYHIRVWGQDIDYDHAVSLTWNDHVSSEPQSWWQGLERAMEVADVSDSLERERLEREFYPTFALLNAEVTNLITKARDVIKAMPVPSSATIRAEHHMWKAASSKLRKEFPLLFDSDLPEK